MVALLIAGIAAFLAGILALLFGIPIKEFSFGNTMIITGAVIASAGMLTIGMWILAREMRALAARVGVAATSPAIVSRADARGDVASVLRPAPEPVVIGDITAPPVHDDDAPPPLPKASRAELELPAAEPPPAAKPKRNLLFSSSSRRERDRAAAKAAEEKEIASEAADLPPPPPAPPFDPAAAASNIPDADPRDSFESAWPQAEIARPAGASPLRRETPDGERPVPPPPRPRQEPRMETRPIPTPSDVTVLKSGVVDGMAYSLYSDGSIEAQMPEGMVRFASIDELRAHLDGRA